MLQPFIMLIPDWLLPTFRLLPALLLMFVGVGLPWALALLPRHDWRDRALVLALSLALGPALTTAGLFVLGTFGRFTVVSVLIIPVALGLVGAIFAARRIPHPPAPKRDRQPINPVNAVLTAVIVVAVLLRFWNTAYWPFTTYDALWVYGYNARVFLLHESIPASIGYYPQLVPLAYTYGQVLWHGGGGMQLLGQLNDHAARIVIPWFAGAGILMVYVLGARLFSHRVGLLAAAMWALYPHHAVWSQFGDLEVTVTLYFTGTAAFFALAWRERQPRYALIAGLLLGAALWTKPTSAALVQSVGLIALIAFVAIPVERRPVLRLALITGLAAAPIGGMWYIRNILYGHPPLVMPAGYWQAEAQRSGQELGWPLLIALVGAAVLALSPHIGRNGRRLILLAVVALLVGILPSAFGWRVPTFAELRLLALGQIVPQIKTTRLGPLEYLLIVASATLLVRAAYPAWRRLSDSLRYTILTLVAFIVPYFVTWFWSYSYHFRLSFPIVPLMIVLLAVLIDALAHRVPIRAKSAWRWAAVVGIVVLALPGWWAVLTALEPAASQTLATDDEKIAQGNPALMGLVEFLRARRTELGRPLRIVVPGESRLGFFFPLDEIDYTHYPLWLDDLAGVDYFVESSPGRRLYAEQGILYNQVLASLTRDLVMQRVYTVDDGNFRFSVYTTTNANRYIKPDPNGDLNVQVGDFAYLWGYDLSTLTLPPGANIYLTFWWEALKPADLDYSVFIHLWDAEHQRLIAAWGGQPVEGAFSVWQNVPGDHFSVPYPTRLWQAEEIIKDEWKVQIPLDAPPGRYELRAGLHEPLSGKRLPVTQDGKPLGDSILLHWFEVQPAPR